MSENIASPDHEQSSDRSNRGRVVLLMILLVFLSPWIFALLWKSQGRINHGELIEPARPLPEVSLIAEQGGAASVQDFRGKWNWVVLVDQVCNDDCVNKLDLLRQVRIAQKKHVKRLRYSLLVVDPVDPNSSSILTRSVLDAHPDMMLRVAEQNQHAAFLSTFRDGAPAEELAGATIYVVDPLGNVMMKYRTDPGRPEAQDTEDSATLQPKHLHRDMARLLKASQVG